MILSKNGLNVVKIGAKIGERERKKSNIVKKYKNNFDFFTKISKINGSHC